MSLTCSVALATTVYKWVDENGLVHYSDQPHPNAQKLQIQSAQTYRSSPVDPETGAAAQPAATSPVGGYQGCAIAQPAPEEEFANIDSLNIAVRTDPALHPGDQIFIMLDGTLVNGGQPTGTSFTVTPVERGAHTVQAVVRNSDGELMCQTPGVTFSVHQPSIKNPVNPIRPH